MNKHVARNVGELLETAVRFVDTKKDRDLIKVLFARKTRVKHTAKMLNVKGVLLFVMPSISSTMNSINSNVLNAHHELSEMT